MPITKLELWVQSVLPTVYDDSLSYLEFLGKVQAKVNEIIESDAETRVMVESFITQFGPNLNEMVDTIMAGFVTDGTLASLIETSVLVPLQNDVEALKTEDIDLNIQLSNIMSRLEMLEQPALYSTDLFALGGQSNMQGQSEAPITFEITAGRAYEYKLLTNTYTTVKHPFGENIGDLLLGAHLGYGGLAPKFAEAYYNSTGIPPLMVGVSKGDTTIEQWLKAGSRADRYAKMVEKINGASSNVLAINRTVRNKYFVWLQGESDGISNTTKAQYKERFLQLWTDLKADCGFAKCFIIRVTKFYAYDLLPIMQAQEELANENADIIMATRITSSFTTANGLMQAIWHYTNAGYNLVGSTAGQKISEYIKTGLRPALEADPFLKKFVWNFRTGTIQEVNNKITITPIGSPIVNSNNVEIVANSGYSLSSDIILTGDFTYSITYLNTQPVVGNSGAMLANGGLAGAENDNNYLFYYFTGNSMNVRANGNAYTMEINPAGLVKSVYNHYVIQRDGTWLRTYINNVLMDSVETIVGPLTLKSLFVASNNDYDFIGKIKHMLIMDNVELPINCDPTFYNNNEQGTV